MKRDAAQSRLHTLHSVAVGYTHRHAARAPTHTRARAGSHTQPRSAAPHRACARSRASHIQYTHRLCHATRVSPRAGWHKANTPTPQRHTRLPRPRLAHDGPTARAQLPHRARPRAVTRPRCDGRNLRPSGAPRSTQLLLATPSPPQALLRATATTMPPRAHTPTHH